MADFDFVAYVSIGSNNTWLANEAVTTATVTLSDNDSDGDFEQSTVDRVDGQAPTFVNDDYEIEFANAGIVRGWLIQTSTTLIFIPTDGTIPSDDIHIRTVSVNGDNQIGPLCFARGTLIQTTDGEVPVEKLTIGDMVKTIDGHHRPIRWVGSSSYDSTDLTLKKKLRPVRITAGALGTAEDGSAIPKRDLFVSRQHRVLVRSKIVQKMFGLEQVLVPAIKLTELAGIDIVDNMEELEYFHLLFEQHEVVSSDGVWTESLFTDPEALKSLASEARKEIFTIFPELSEMPSSISRSTFYITDNKMQKKLIERHLKNKKSLVSETVSQIIPASCDPRYISLEKISSAA